MSTYILLCTSVEIGFIRRDYFEGSRCILSRANLVFALCADGPTFTRVILNESFVS